MGKKVGSTNQAVGTKARSVSLLCHCCLVESGLFIGKEVAPSSSGGGLGVCGTFLKVLVDCYQFYFDRTEFYYLEFWRHNRFTKRVFAKKMFSCLVFGN